jgi:8-oxo-dGTP pyrophosphatase MutT (NUDIX family)
MAKTRPIVPRLAAAIVLMRAGHEGQLEVFMVRRHAQSSFVPDKYVFPGGSVSPDDHETELAPGLCAPVGEGPTTLGSGFRAAAIRECFEEAGVLLARRGGELLGAQDLTHLAEQRQALQDRAITLRAIAEQAQLTLATDALIHWAHWITPEPYYRRFDTHFFLTEMPASQGAAHDEVETTASAWVTPKEALAFQQDSFPLAFAQVRQLEALAEVASPEDARARFNDLVPRTIMPRIVERDGVSWILMPDEE